jgi:hypothetical protein
MISIILYSSIIFGKKNPKILLNNIDGRNTIFINLVKLISLGSTIKLSYLFLEIIHAKRYKPINELPRKILNVEAL